MPRYLTSHNMACMTRQGVGRLAEQMRSSPEAGFLRLLANMTDGQIVAEFEVASRGNLEQWMQKAGVHYERISRMDVEATPDGTRDL